jgi:hypothetical protein
MFNLYILNCLLWNDMSKHVALIMRPTVIEFVVCDGTYGTCEYCEQNLAWLRFLAVCIAAVDISGERLLFGQFWTVFFCCDGRLKNKQQYRELYIMGTAAGNVKTMCPHLRSLRHKQQCTAVCPAWQF